MISSEKDYFINLETFFSTGPFIITRTWATNELTVHNMCPLGHPSWLTWASVPLKKSWSLLDSWCQSGRLNTLPPDNTTHIWYHWTAHWNHKSCKRCRIFLKTMKSTLEKCSSHRQVTEKWRSGVDTIPRDEDTQSLYLCGAIIIKELGKYIKSLNFYKNSLSKEHAEKVKCGIKDVE